jgi:hypothetical protein
MCSIRKSIFIIIAMSVSLFAQTDTGHYYIMSYFKNVYAPSNDASGGFFALSTDGLNWTELNGGAPIVPPNPLGTFLCRDPFLFWDNQAGLFRYVYTTGWLDTIMGYAQITPANGKDFKVFQNWDKLDAQGRRQIPIVDKIPLASCTWAPEIIWDDLQNKYMIYWSTEIGNQGKRAYYILTSDFKTFTDPVKFFDPGFAEIDGDLLKVAENSYYFIFKDERDAGKKLFYVTGPTPQGPWSTTITGPITLANLSGVEGPTALKFGDQYRVYFDPYSARANYRMVYSTDLVTWKDGGTIKAGGANFYYSHCNIQEIPKNIYDWITTGALSVHQVPRSLSPIYSAGARFEVPGVYDLMGKKIVTRFSWPGQNAAVLPAGFHVTVGKDKRVVKELQTQK